MSRLLCLIAGVLLLNAGGCNVVGALASKVAGPTPVEAKFTLPQEPLVVMVENYTQPQASLGDGEMLARAIFNEIETRKLAPQIDPAATAEIRSSSPGAYRQMTISQIGARVGARHVLYVNLIHSSIGIAEGSELMRGEMHARVRVIDTATGQARWPNDSAEGFPVGIQTKVMHPRDGYTRDSARAQLVREMADATTKLFYKWKPDNQPLGEE